jgi:hypothetical protein
MKTAMMRGTTDNALRAVVRPDCDPGEFKVIGPIPRTFPFPTPDRIRFDPSLLTLKGTARPLRFRRFRSRSMKYSPASPGTGTHSRVVGLVAQLSSGPRATATSCRPIFGTLYLLRVRDGR